MTMGMEPQALCLLDSLLLLSLITNHLLLFVFAACFLRWSYVALAGLGQAGLQCTEMHQSASQLLGFKVYTSHHRITR